MKPAKKSSKQEKSCFVLFLHQKKISHEYYRLINIFSITSNDIKKQESYRNTILCYSM